MEVGDIVRIITGYHEGLTGCVVEVKPFIYLIYFDNGTWSWQKSFKVMKIRKTNRVIKKTIWT